MIRRVLARFGGWNELLGDVRRFLGAGFVNTALSLAAYWALLTVAPAPVAYAASWTLGLIFVAAAYPSHVFRIRNASAKARCATVVVYLIGFGIGLATVSAFSFTFDAERFAVLVALVATTSFNFVAMRMTLGANER